MGRLILLVEDNEADEMLFRMALSKAGLDHDIAVARTGEDALAMMSQVAGRKGGAMPHLVVLDMNLPKMSGLDVLEKIRATEATKDIPVVIFTGTATLDQMQSAARFPNSTVMRKPVGMQDYISTVYRIVHGWLYADMTEKRGKELI